MANKVFCADLKFALFMRDGVKVVYSTPPTANILTLVQNWWELSTVIDYAKMQPSGKKKVDTMSLMIAAKETILVKKKIQVSQVLGLGNGQLHKLRLHKKLLTEKWQLADTIRAVIKKVRLG